MVEQAEFGEPSGNGTASPLPAAELAERVDPSRLIRASVLVLNLNYVPVNICSVRRAVVVLGKGKAEL